MSEIDDIIKENSVRFVAYCAKCDTEIIITVFPGGKTRWLCPDCKKYVIRES